ncbi:MAG TPA: TauD/TfdA family dioxygenase [Pyrinomonadaceae bacterium]|nr:TauD/TfdA family dioxygenase [Pyrinomonadaceae bacterium]
MALDFQRFRTAQRKSVSLSAESLVRVTSPDKNLPLLIEPEIDKLNLAVWAGYNRELVENNLLRHGAILFRGFELETVERFEEFVKAISPELLEYRERSSPRSEISKGVYTSTDHPADQSIHFHNEQSYTQSWPMKLWFFCMQAAKEGGATPIADGRRVLQLLDAQTRERFTRKQVMYVRNYGEGLGLSWQTAFQTSNKLEVENYCRTHAMDFTWKANDGLRTRQVFDPIVVHPRTNEAVWFEHTAFFHISSLEPAVRAAILEEFAEEDLPFNTYYGDGSPIETSALAQIRHAYRQTAIRFSWQEQDVLLIDNVLTSHGREPFVGPRKIVVTMTELFHKNR